MATTKLGLPTVTSNMSADVPRDLNALAEAVDAVVASKAELEATNTAVGQAKQETTAHIADYVKHPGTGKTTNSGNAYAVTLNPAPPSYADQMGVIITVNANSTGASTLNINGLGAKPIKKANGNDVTNLKANGVYTLRYNADTGNFILQGEGASGNASASDLLSGKTASTDAGDIEGTMLNRGAPIFTPSGTEQNISSGYYSGGVIKPITISSGESLWISNNTEVGTIDRVWKRLKSIKINNMSGTVRVRFDLMINTENTPVSAQIYKNGVAVGTMRSTTSTSYVTYTEDISFSRGDEIQLYVKEDYYTGYVRNFRLYISIDSLVSTDVIM